MDMYKISKLELDAIHDRMNLIAGAIGGQYPLEACLDWIKDVKDWCSDVLIDTLDRKEYNAINEPVERP